MIVKEREKDRSRQTNRQVERDGQTGRESLYYIISEYIKPRAGVVCVDNYRRQTNTFDNDRETRSAIRGQRWVLGIEKNSGLIITTTAIKIVSNSETTHVFPVYERKQTKPTSVVLKGNHFVIECPNLLHDYMILGDKKYCDLLYWKKLMEI